MPLNVPISHWHNALTLCNTHQLLQCSTCQTRCERIDAQAEPSAILFIELSSDAINCIQFDENIAVSGKAYCLEGLVRNFASHYSCAVFQHGQWVLYDDLSNSIPTFISLQNLFQNAFSGWFFGVYVNVEARINRNSVNAEFIHGQIPSVSLTNASEEGSYSDHHKSQKSQNNFETPFNEHETITRKEVDHDAEILNNFAIEPKRRRLQQMTQQTNLQWHGSPQESCEVVCDKSKIKDTLNIPNYDQPLHQQECCKLHMKAFHNSMQLKMYHCTVCKEIWPLREKKRNSECFICRRFKLDKNEPKRFSSENNMIPSPVPDALFGLSQCEEIFMSRAFPVIQVYTKSGGSYGYKGHVINFPNNVQHVADVLPHCAKDIPIVAFTIKGKNDFEREFKVRGEKVLNALL